MAEGISFDANGLARVERDPRWAGDVRREMLHGILEVERRAVATNLTAWSVAALFAAMLPNAAAFVVPLGVRILAMLSSRLAYARMRASLGHEFERRRALARLTAAQVLSGASCAPILTPILLDPVPHPARLVVGGTVIVGVTIVLSLLAPVPRLATAFASGFLAAFAAIILWARGLAGAPTIGALCALLSIVFIYGVAMSIRHRNAAETLVDNQRLSEELSSSLAHAEFLALHDPLTGQYNRRAFFQLAAAASERDRHVLTIDLDHFKAINDRHGHAAGDAVLVGVGQALRAVLGELDAGDHFSARLGGEEFVMVIDVANPELAGAVAEMARHAIGLIGPSGPLRPLTTSASIGLCRWAPGESIDDVLSRADAALFQAKARGRDRVMAAAA